MGNLLDKKIGRYIRHSIPGFVTYERVCHGWNFLDVCRAKILLLSCDQCTAYTVRTSPRD